MNNIIIYPTLDNFCSELVCYGIDLGTSTTILTLVNPSDVDFNKSWTIPVKKVQVRQESPRKYDSDIISEEVASIVAFCAGKVYVGSNLQHLKGLPGYKYKKNMFYHWKLELGIEHTPLYPNAINSKVDMPFKIAGGILNYLKIIGLQNKGEMKQTIITVPASFQVNQRNDVLKAAKMAKIVTSKHMLIDEPNAAFLGYFNRLPNEEKVSWSHQVADSNVLILDYGGGTLDLSILNVTFQSSSGIAISNIAISRYNDLGGQDIDWLLAEEFLYPKLLESYSEFQGVSFGELNEWVLPQLATIGEWLKIGVCKEISMIIVDKLTSEVDLSAVRYTHTSCQIEYGSEIYNLGDISISAEEFDVFFKKLFFGKEYSFKYQDKVVRTLSSSITDIIEKAEIGLDEISHVLLVGNSCLNPYVRTYTQHKIKKAKTLYSHEPGKLVSEGAAVYSYFYYTHGVSLISPIASDTLGIIVKGEQFYPIIEKGTQLPVRVELPHFRLQTNLNNEIVVPICMGDKTHPVGEIRAPVNNLYDMDTVVQINAEVTEDKTFLLELYIGKDQIDNVSFDNPFGLGKMTPEILILHQKQSALNKSIQLKNYAEEKKLQRSIIWDYSSVGNYKGCLEAVERYEERFDDQDGYVGNMKYIANNRLGRRKAAREALEASILNNPRNSTLAYNYSLMIQREEGIKEALNYLESKVEELEDNDDVKLRIIMLRSQLGQDVSNEAREVVRKFKNQPSSYGNFAKQSILENVFNLVNEPYSYLKPDVIEEDNKDKNKYLDLDNLPY